jgi:hypothetical protein
MHMSMCFVCIAQHCKSRPAFWLTSQHLARAWAQRRAQRRAQPPALADGTTGQALPPRNRPSVASALQGHALTLECTLHDARPRRECATQPRPVSAPTAATPADSQRFAPGAAATASGRSPRAAAGPACRSCRTPGHAEPAAQAPPAHAPRPDI